MSSAHKYSWTRVDGSKVTRWRAKWLGADGKPTTKRGFDRQSDALGYAGDREAEARHGVTLAGERPTGRTTVETWSAAWLAAQEVRASSLESYGYAVKRINATLGGRSLASLRQSELKAWRRGLAAKYAATTADYTASVLAMILRAAVLDDLIPASPMPRAGGGADGRVVDPDEILSLEQVRAWGEGMRPRKTPSPRHRLGPPVAVEMPVFAAQTGLRLGELLGLRPEDVDFLRRQVSVDHQLRRDGTYGPPKTVAGVRTVPLPVEAAEALARHLEVQPPVPGEPLFRSVTGRRWRRGTFWQVWEDGRVAAKLPEWVHWHALRDVYASSLIYLGQDLRVIMTLMGHTSSEETLRTYGRLWPKATDTTRTALDGLWRPDEGHGSTTSG